MSRGNWWTLLNFLVVTAIVFGAIHAYCFNGKALITVGRIALWIMTASIVFGIILYLYIKISSKRIFDPLDTVLDEDPREKH